jgi:hypothetical protein
MWGFELTTKLAYLRKTAASIAEDEIFSSHVANHNRNCGRPMS